MSKLFLLVVALAVGALVMGGAVEIKFHPDQLSNVPGRVLDYLNQQGVLAKVWEQVDRIKNTGTELVLNRYLKSDKKEETPTEDGVVAGIKDKQEILSPSPTSKIPLQF